MVMMFFHFIIGFVDVWVAGKIHQDVQASLGIITQCLFFLLVVAIAVANGSVAAIGQSAGAGLYRRARRYVALVLALGMVMGVVVLAGGFLFKEPFLNLLQVPERIRPITSYFFDVYLYVLPMYYMLNITNAVFRARKMVLVPLGCMMLVSLVNTVADFGLGLGWWGFPEMGYAGVAWATFFSVSAGALFNVIMLLRKGLLRRDSLAPWRWARCAAPYLIKVALPAGGMQVMWQAGYLVLFAITASLPFGSIDALAGMTAGMRIESLLFLPAFAFNMTASILVGHFLGAGQKAEAKRVGLRILLMACGSLTVVAMFMWPFVPEICAVLSPAPAVQAQAAVYLKYNLVSIPFTVASMTLGGIMTGAGATLYTFIVYSSATWLVRLPVAYVMGHQVWGDSEGVFIAMLISQVFQSGTMFWLFMYHDWSRFSMIKRNGNRNNPAGASAGSSLEGVKSNVRSGI
ncbi:MATE family efflux transporter [Oleidesulfovibrio sp.]|uniref:MATE family efflux transporter n=1 Tax=Oleidesulfovibrio sp. TaxID=2909707 RepID=UPI003A8A8665